MSEDLALRICQALRVKGQFQQECQTHFKSKLPTLSQHSGCQKSPDPQDCYVQVVTNELQRNYASLSQSQARLYSRWGLLSELLAKHYTPTNDPFAANDRIKKIAREIMAQGGDLVQNLFNRLHRGGPEGVKTDFQNDVGKTAIETLLFGGDCSDLSNLTIAVIRELNRLGANIKGGAKVIHFQDSEPDIHHLVPYVVQKGKEIIVDLQARILGQTGPEKYKVISIFSNFEASASVYHLEWGNYFKDQQDWNRAITAYGRAVSIDGKNALANENLAKAQVKKKAIQIEKAKGRRDWRGCIRYLEETVPWLPYFPGKEKKDIQQQVLSQMEACRHNLKQDETRVKLQKIATQLNHSLDLAEKATQDGRWEDCDRHLSRALVLNGQLPQEEEDNRQRTDQIRAQLEICRRQKNP